jgi:hypothetical protein
MVMQEDARCGNNQQVLRTVHGFASLGVHPSLNLWWLSQPGLLMWLGRDAGFARLGMIYMPDDDAPHFRLAANYEGTVCMYVDFSNGGPSALKKVYD